MRNSALCDVFDYVDALWSTARMQSYPPTDFRKISETEFELIFAVAGFAKEDIEVILSGSTLVVQGAKIKKVGDGDDFTTKSNFIYNGISNKPFKRSISLAKDAVVKNVSMKDGLLTIKICREITGPDTKKFTID